MKQLWEFTADDYDLAIKQYKAVLKAYELVREATEVQMWNEIANHGTVVDTGLKAIIKQLKILKGSKG